jgi:hypothetical protein
LHDERFVVIQAPERVDDRSTIASKAAQLRAARPDPP